MEQLSVELPNLGCVCVCVCRFIRQPPFSPLTSSTPPSSPPPPYIHHLFIMTLRRLVKWSWIYILRKNTVCCIIIGRFLLLGWFLVLFRSLARTDNLGRISIASVPSLHQIITGCSLNIVFSKNSRKFATSPSPALGCYWLRGRGWSELWKT